MTSFACGSSRGRQEGDTSTSRLTGACNASLWLSHVTLASAVCCFLFLMGLWRGPGQACGPAWRHDAAAALSRGRRRSSAVAVATVLPVRGQCLLTSLACQCHQADAKTCWAHTDGWRIIAMNSFWYQLCLYIYFMFRRNKVVSFCQNCAGLSKTVYFFMLVCHQLYIWCFRLFIKSLRLFSFLSLKHQNISLTCNGINLNCCSLFLFDLIFISVGTTYNPACGDMVFIDGSSKLLTFCLIKCTKHNSLLFVTHCIIITSK